jgi:hypothetical protein
METDENFDHILSFDFIWTRGEKGRKERQREIRKAQWRDMDHVSMTEQIDVGDDRKKERESGEMCAVDSGHSLLLFALLILCLGSSADGQIGWAAGTILVFVFVVILEKQRRKQ